MIYIRTEGLEDDYRVEIFCFGLPLQLIRAINVTHEWLTCSASIYICMYVCSKFVG